VGLLISSLNFAAVGKMGKRQGEGGKFDWLNYVQSSRYLQWNVLKVITFLSHNLSIFVLLLPVSELLVILYLGLRCSVWLTLSS